MPSYDGRQLSSTLRFLSGDMLISSGTSGGQGLNVLAQSSGTFSAILRCENRRDFLGATSDQEEQKASVDVAALSLKPAGGFNANWNNYPNYSRSASDRRSTDVAV